MKVLDLRPNTKPLVPAGDQETNKLYILNEYSKAIKKCDCDVTVAYLEGEEDKEVERRTAGDKVLFLRTKKIKPIGKILPSALKLRKILKYEDYDIVISHWLKPGMVLGLAALFQSIQSKYIVMHGPSNLQRFRRKLFAFLFLRKRFTYIAVSRAMRNYLLKINWKISSDKVVTLYNAIDIKKIEKNQLSRQEARKKFGLQKDDICFVTIGWLMPHKGHMLILQALEFLGAKVPNLKMVIIGDGRLSEFLQQETRKKQLEKKVFFSGELPDAYQYLTGFDAFVLPSLREPFGMVLLEAMAAKLPIIASEVGGIPEVIGSVGTLVPPKDHRALAEAIQDHYLKSRPEREKLGIRTYNRLWENFSSETFTHKLCSILKRN